MADPLFVPVDGKGLDWPRKVANALNNARLAITGKLDSSAIGSTVQAWDADLDALAAVTGTNTIYYRSAANTWSAVTMGAGVSFAGGALSATGSGGIITSVSGTAPIVSSGGTTPAISIGAATSIAAGSMSAADKVKLDAISGTNTGDQTSVTGNAGTATALQTPRAINGVAFNGTAAITINAVDSTARVPATRFINTTAPLAGGGDLSADRTLSITAATGSVAGSMSASDKTKLDAITGTNTGDQTRASLRSSCKVTLSASLAANDFNAGYVVPWNTETWDDASWHDNTTNPERMTIPAGIDRVELMAGLRLTGLTASVTVLVQILKNGATVVASNNGYNTGTTMFIPIFGAEACVAGDYFTVKVNQSGGTTSGAVAAAASTSFVVKAV